MLPDDILRVTFAGQGGIGSDGNPQGEQMRQAVHAALREYAPRALIIDICGFDYRFGNWICAVMLTAIRALGRGRVCVLATGETATALRSLLEWSKLDGIIPQFGDLRDALAYLSGPEETQSRLEHDRGRF